MPITTINCKQCTASTVINGYVNGLQLPCLDSLIRIRVKFIMFQSVLVIFNFPNASNVHFDRCLYYLIKFGILAFIVLHLLFLLPFLLFFYLFPFLFLSSLYCLVLSSFCPTSTVVVPVLSLCQLFHLSSNFFL